MIDTAPAVSVIIATRGRPQLLRQAVRSILGQRYSGDIDVTIVFDQVEIDPLSDVIVPERRFLRTIVNKRVPGLAGARNTGILSVHGRLVAFCDDDDEWNADKLARQTDAWGSDPDARMVATGIRIETGKGSHIRLPPERVSFADLLDSRITEMHPSSFLFRLEDLLGDIGLVDEELPASYGEDYDMLLRATRAGHVRNVVAPLVVVHWNRASFFSGKWEGITDGLSYLLAKYPEFASSPRGSARVEGQIAFAYAALGRRRDARAWARRALEHDRRQLRAYAALAVALRIMSPAMMLNLVNSRGRGL